MEGDVIRAEETEATIQQFFWEFVRIAKVIPFNTWPLYYLTHDRAMRELNELASSSKKDCMEGDKMVPFA